MERSTYKIYGITLIEQLLCLSLITLFTITGIARYITYRENQQIAHIESDIQHIFSAMRDYFYSQGCNTDGVFQGKLSALDLENDLQLTTLSHGRTPYIKVYQAEIITLPFSTKNKKNLYQFNINALTSENTSQQKKKMLLMKIYGSTINENKQTLEWKIQPTQLYQHKKSTWVMGAHLRYLRNNSHCAQ